MLRHHERHHLAVQRAVVETHHAVHPDGDELSGVALEDGRILTAWLGLDGQEAQKSHGLCRGGPDVANLPAGEIYYVPAGAEGRFPMRYEDGTLGIMHVTGGRIVLTQRGRLLADAVVRDIVG